MGFYPPFVTEIAERAFICYTDADMAKLFVGGIGEDEARKIIDDFAFNWHRQSFEGQEFVPDDTDFMIGFLWTMTGFIFIDVWLNRQLATYGECGPMKTLQTFQLDGKYVDHWKFGNGCDWTNIVTGREAEYRREVMGRNNSLHDYLYGERPEMPEGFIIPWPDEIDPNLIGKTN